MQMTAKRLLQAENMVEDKIYSIIGAVPILDSWGYSPTWLPQCSPVYGYK